MPLVLTLPLGLENLARAPAPDILVHLVHLVPTLELKQGLKPGQTRKDLAGTKQALKQALKPGPLLGLVQTVLKEVLRPVLKPVLPQVPRRAQVHPALKQGLKQELLPERPPEPARTKLALRQARELEPLLGQTQKDLAQRRSQEQEQEQARRPMLDLELPYHPTRTTTPHLRHRRPRVSHSLPPA